MSDYNTSRQMMMARRSSSGDVKESGGPVRAPSASGRDSSPSPLRPPPPGMMMYTPSLHGVVETGQPQLLRQNVIQGGGPGATWHPSLHPPPPPHGVKGPSGLPPQSSVIQTVKSTNISPREHGGSPHAQRASPQPQHRKTIGPTSIFNPALDNFQTLVNAAAAQQAVPVPPSGEKQRMLLVKSESPSRSQASDRPGPQSSRDIWTSAGPDPNDPSRQARDRIRQIFLTTSAEQQQQEQSKQTSQGDKSRRSPQEPERSSTDRSGRPTDHYRPHPMLSHIRSSGSSSVSSRTSLSSTTSADHLDSRQAAFNEEASRLLSQSFQKDGGGGGGGVGTGGRLTTGNLIDAIITHQINLSTDGKKNDHREENGRLTLPPSIRIPVPPPPVSESYSIPTTTHAGGDPHAPHIAEAFLQANQLLAARGDGPAKPPTSEILSTTTAKGPVTLGDHISSIINKTIGTSQLTRTATPPGIPVTSTLSPSSSGITTISPPTSRPGSSSPTPLAAVGSVMTTTTTSSTPPVSSPLSERTSSPSTMSTSWKLRRALQQEKEEASPSSTPTQNEGAAPNEENPSAVKEAGPTRPPSSSPNITATIVTSTGPIVEPISPPVTTQEEDRSIAEKDDEKPSNFSEEKSPLPLVGAPESEPAIVQSTFTPTTNDDNKQVSSPPPLKVDEGKVVGESLVVPAGVTNETAEFVLEPNDPIDQDDDGDRTPPALEILEDPVGSSETDHQPSPSEVTSPAPLVVAVPSIDGEGKEHPCPSSGQEGNKEPSNEATLTETKIEEVKTETSASEPEVTKPDPITDTPTTSITSDSNPTTSS